MDKILNYVNLIITITKFIFREVASFDTNTKSGKIITTKDFHCKNIPKDNKDKSSQD